MKLFSLSTITGIAILTSALVVGCGTQAKMERCQFVEIEPAEFEVEFGDIDLEGGEVEMVCGDKIVDVPWKQFQKKLRIDPEGYLRNLEGFKRQVSCLINESSKEQVIFCSRPRLDAEFVTLTFNYDD